jgi:hypothetical protein
VKRSNRVCDLPIVPGIVVFNICWSQQRNLEGKQLAPGIPTMRESKAAWIFVTAPALQDYGSLNHAAVFNGP